MHKTFQAFTEEKKRNAISYILQVIMASFAFVLQIYGGVDILFRWEETTDFHRTEWAIFALQTIAVLYIWEIIYRTNIGVPLLLHHIVTLLLVQLSFVSLNDTGNVIYTRLAILLGFHATTEQLSFVALFCYRMKIFRGWHAALFVAAAIQTFLLKTAITIFSFVYFCVLLKGEDFDDQPTNWKWFWKVCFIPLLFLLFAAQLYACKILWDLHSKCLSPTDPPTLVFVDKMFKTNQQKMTTNKMK